MANEEENGLTGTAEVTAIAAEQVGRRIYAVRGQNVMLDSDLAELYGVETSALNRAVKRNAERSAFLRISCSNLRWRRHGL